MRIKHDSLFENETRKLLQTVKTEQVDALRDIRTLKMKQERILRRRNELELILSEITINKGLTLKVQKPECWAM